MWRIEDINNYHCLYVRVHKGNVKPDSSPTASAFVNTPKDGGNLSSDWCKYTSPEISRSLIGRQKNGKGEYKNPLDFYIWKFQVSALRLMDVKQIVVHEPFYQNPEIDGSPNNRAHSIIIGSKPVNHAEFKIKIRRAGEWAVPP